MGQLDYVDSYIIHWPTACPSTGKNVTLRTNGSYLANHKENTMFPCTDEGYFCHDPESHYVETWKAMEKLVDSGKANLSDSPISTQLKSRKFYKSQEQNT